jgi:sugar/nucleoside kinase (ribokinase family)
MARFLQDLLTTNDPLFPFAMHQLEKSTGHDGVDVRLIADITHKAHDIMRTLGLDPADTTARELYLALNAYSHQSDSQEVLFDADYVLLNIEGEVVSFNLIDVIENAHHELGFEKRLVAHGQRSLRGEIIARYTDHPRTEESVTQQLALDTGLLTERDQWYTKPNTNQIQTEDEDKTMQPYVLAVGDIITDDFIKLSEDHAEVTTDEKGYKRLSFELGAKLPYESVEKVEAVECSPNAAVSMTRLGLSTSLMSWLGDDEPGKGMTAYLQKQGVGTDDLVVEPGMKSNYHYVLRYGADRTKLQRFENYSYQWREPARKPDWLYLGVLGEKTWPLHEAMLRYLGENPDVKLVFQPGMYHLMWGTEKMRPFYERAEIVILNREEAAQVTGVDRGDVQALIRALHELGVRVAVVTDGPDGAYASDGTKVLSMPNYPDPAEPYDRTGAGDAFASTITAALALGENLETALRWAPINSMSVVQKLGAQAGLLNRDELQKYLDEAPDWYQPTELGA